MPLEQGIRLFDQLEPEPIRLERTRVEADPGGMTHLFYDVVR